VSHYAGDDCTGDHDAILAEYAEQDKLRQALQTLQAKLHEVFCAPDRPDDEWCEFGRLVLEKKYAAAYRQLDEAG
jgi:hypothetical protein